MKSEAKGSDQASIRVSKVAARAASKLLQKQQTKTNYQLLNKTLLEL